MPVGVAPDRVPDMLPPKRMTSGPQQRLLKLFKRLAPAQQECLLNYAEFLTQQAPHEHTGGRSVERMEPLDIPRPDAESVIGAIRRLSETFPMLDKNDLFHETSELMTAHVMQGRSANEVIDELEIIFRRHYERVKSTSEQ